MKTWVRKTLSAGVLAAGALLLVPGAAHADIDQASVSSGGALNGTQIAAPINIPVNVTGIGLGVLGEGVGVGGSSAAANSTESHSVSQASASNGGLLNGTQAYVPVSVPVNVCGIGVGILGTGAGQCDSTGGSNGGGYATESGDVSQASVSDGGLLNGTQAYVPVNVPINVGGIGVGVLGTGVGQQSGAQAARSNSTESVNQASASNGGLLNGTQVYAPVNVPINVGGIGLGVLGTGVGQQSGAQAGGNSNSSEGASQASVSNGGALNGTQVAAPVNVPVNVCGIGVGILGGGAGSCTTGGNNGGGNNGGGNNGGGYNGGSNNGGSSNGGSSNGGASNGGSNSGYGAAQGNHVRKAKKNSEALPVDGFAKSLPLGGTDVLGGLR